MKNKISFIVVDYKNHGQITVIRGWGKDARYYPYSRSINQAFYIAGYNGYKVISVNGKEHKSYIFPNP